jgi:hypothetical protein
MGAVGIALTVPADGAPARAPRIVAAAPGSVSASITGPSSITVPRNAAPDRFDYAVTLTYQGPPIVEPVETRWTVRTPQHVFNPGIGDIQGNVFDCTFTEPGVPAPVASCTTGFVEGRRATSFHIGVRPTGEGGTGSATLEVATGATATWTTAFTRAPLPPPPLPPPPSPPAPIPGPAAAPTQTVTETFTAPGEAEAESVAVAPSADTVQVALTWRDSGSSFDVTGVRLVSSGRLLAATSPELAERLRIKKRRTARSLDVRVKGVKRGKLRFKIVARRLDGTTRVKVKIRQSKR